MKSIVASIELPHLPMKPSSFDANRREVGKSQPAQNSLRARCVSQVLEG